MKYPGRIHRLMGALLLFGLTLNGCATPVGVNEVSSQQAYLDVYSNPLSSAILSDQAKYVLHRYALLDGFQADPAGVIAALHEKALHDDRLDILYALAEASYLYAGQLAKSIKAENRNRAPDYFLLASIYAYYFVLEPRSESRPSVFDRRARNALDLYNFGLWQGFATGKDGNLVLQGRVRDLPVGRITFTLETSQLPWTLSEFERFEPADKFSVRGVSVLNRIPGIGLPLVAVKREPKDIFEAGQVLPVTAFLRIQGDLESLTQGTTKGSLELYSTQEVITINLNNRQIPLEADFTTPLAFSLEGSKTWDFGIKAFLGREPSTVPDGLYLQEPYRPNKIPVVFVHGTASSPVWWTEMFNTLSFDPFIRQNYQFWYFVYASNKPIVMSAAELRAALREKLATLDPEGKDAALRQMVVIGHSQGGLLTKLSAVRTQDELLRAITGESLESLNLAAGETENIRRLFYIEPLPFIGRVVFLSTPHRGSFRSKRWNRNLVKRIVRLPAELVEASQKYYHYLTDDVRSLEGAKSVWTSADGMSPDNPLLAALADLPLAPWVKGHSIIAVKGAGDPTQGDDGVVEYTSAHLEGMESEFIVRGGHSSQLHPLAIDEIHRILSQHYATAAAAR